MPVTYLPKWRVDGSPRRGAQVGPGRAEPRVAASSTHRYWVDVLESLAPSSCFGVVAAQVWAGSENNPEGEILRIIEQSAADPCSQGLADDP